MTAERQNRIRRLGRRLGRLSREAREEAIREARSLSPEDLHLLVQEMVIASPPSKFDGLVGLLTLLCAVTILPLSTIIIGEEAMPLAIGISAVLLVFYGRSDRQFVQARVRDSLSKVVCDIEDPRYLGPMLTLLGERNRMYQRGRTLGEQMLLGEPKPMFREMERVADGVRSNLMVSLKRMLLQLPDDAALSVSREEMDGLLSCLETPFESVTLTLHILRALKKIGDESAIPAVEKLLSQSGTTVDGRRIAEAARECLPFLRERAAQREQAQTLLRASDSRTLAAPETLLRPAGATTASDGQTPAELLRPSLLKENPQ